MRADAVVSEVVREMRAWLAVDVPVGAHLADQLLLPLALGAGGRFRTMPLMRHTHTNAAAIARLLPGVRIDVEEEGGVATVTVTPAP